MSRSSCASATAMWARRAATSTRSRSRGSPSRSFRAARGPRRSDGVPDDLGPGGVLRVSGMQLVGGDPARAADARGAGRTDVDPRERAARRLLMGNLVEGAGQLLDRLPATEGGGGP